jgi:hypothetical protein
MENLTQAERNEIAYTILAGKPEGQRPLEKRIYTIMYDCYRVDIMLCSIGDSHQTTQSNIQQDSSCIVR